MHSGMTLKIEKTNVRLNANVIFIPITLNERIVIYYFMLIYNIVTINVIDYRNNEETKDSMPPSITFDILSV